MNLLASYVKRLRPDEKTSTSRIGNNVLHLIITRVEASPRNLSRDKMHAVVKTSPGPGAVYEPWPYPTKPGLRDILVRVEATSICGTDMQIYDWHELMAHRVKPPLVMGHEFAGKIVEAGKEVSDLEKETLSLERPTSTVENVSSVAPVMVTSVKECFYEGSILMVALPSITCSTSRVPG